MKTIIAALMFFAFSAQASEPWRDIDKTLFVASTALLVADWAQTRYIAKNPDQFYERNPILGKHPSVGKVNAYFAGAIIGNYLLMDYLSPKNRTLYQAGLISVQIVVVGNNKRIGVGMAF